MAKSFGDLPKIMAGHNRRVVGGVQRVARKTANAVQEVAVLSTRADTGKARSNWIVTLGFPHAGDISPYAPGRRLGIGERANASAAISQGKAVIGKWDIDRESSVFTTNNTDYIETLNDGRGRTAPDQMKEKAVIAGVATFRASFKAAIRGK